jgi:hypothetical protein
MAAIWTAVAAIGTLLTFILGLIILISEVIRRRQSQASGVSIAVSSEESHTPAGTTTRAQVVVHNTSPAAVYRVEIDLLPWTWNRNSAALISRTIASMNPISNSNEIEFAGYPPAPPPGPSEVRNRNPPFQLKFTDNSGRRWRRWPDGRLKRVKS